MAHSRILKFLIGLVLLFVFSANAQGYDEGRLGSIPDLASSMLSPHHDGSGFSGTRDTVEGATDCPHEDCKDAGSGDGDLSQESQTVHGVYVVRPSPGKGLGVFATQRLPRGTKILIEEPLMKVTLPEMTPGMGFRVSEMVDSITSSFHRLSPTQQEEYLSLHEYRLDSETDPHFPIFRSNSYNIGDKEVALFPKMARINHSCRPNAGNWWSRKSDARIIYAARDIEKGEEITTSYIPLLMTTSKRNERLAQYGFACDCEACRDGEGAGDRRRKKIADLLEMLEGELYPREGAERTEKGMKRLSAKALSLIELIDEEGLPDYSARSYHLAAVFSQRRKLWADAQMWAEKELEMHSLAEDDSDESRATIEFISGLK